MRPILLYDGDCGFCTASARLIERRIPTKARLSPYQTADLAALGTTPERASGEVLWADGQGVRGGARAIARLRVDADAASRSGTVTNSYPFARRPRIIAGRPRMATRRSRWPVSWASRMVPGSQVSTM